MADVAKASRTSTLLLGILLSLIGALMFCALCAVWPAVESGARESSASQHLLMLFWVWQLRVTSETALMLLVAIFGGLGSWVHVATSFATYVGNRRLGTSWFWWYFLRLPTGSILAVILYCAIRGGLMSGGGTTAEVNTFGIVALAGICGLFAKQAVDKLKDISEVFLGATFGGDRDRVDKLRPNLSAEPVDTTEGVG